MDWAKAIELNHPKLVRIVAELIAMVEITVNGAVSNLISRAVLRVLHPAESAVRRLIVIAARGLKVELPPPRPMPKDRVIVRTGPGNGGGRITFRLSDPPKRYNGGTPKKRFVKVRPRIWSLDPEPPPPMFRPWPMRTPEPAPLPVPEPAPMPEGEARALRLRRRLAAITMALEDIPGQAVRMARLRARRALDERPRLKSPLRPGRPPGYRKEPVEDIDFVLIECHALARDALNEDTS